MRGTFSSQALWGLGGSDPSKETAKNTAEILRLLRRNAMRGNGAAAFT